MSRPNGAADQAQALAERDLHRLVGGVVRDEDGLAPAEPLHALNEQFAVVVEHEDPIPVEPVLVAQQHLIAVRQGGLHRLALDMDQRELLGRTEALEPFAAQHEALHLSLLVDCRPAASGRFGSVQRNRSEFATLVLISFASN